MGYRGVVELRGTSAPRVLNGGYLRQEVGPVQVLPGIRRNSVPAHGLSQRLQRQGLCATQEMQARYASKEYVRNAAWDADKEQGCICDLGYRGPDCSERECKTGTDPMTGEGGYFHGRDCSGRGKCNYGTGLCECFPGYGGERCESFVVTH